MADYVTREEFEARVGVLEQELDGEKLVTRYILEQARRNGDDLATIRTRLDRVETRLDRVETRLDGVDRKVEVVNSSLQSLVKSLPTMMRDVMREVLQERDQQT